MDQQRLRELLERLRSGEIELETALRALERLPFADLGYARVDHHRALRQGVPEVILGAGKTAEQIIGVARRLQEAGENVLVTRLTPELAQAVLEAMPELVYSTAGRTASLVQKVPAPRPGPPVAVVTAGTSDIPVSDHAPQSLGSLQHGEDGDRAENEQVGRAEIGERFPQQERQDRTEVEAL